MGTAADGETAIVLGKGSSLPGQRVVTMLTSTGKLRLDVIVGGSRSIIVGLRMAVGTAGTQRAEAQIRSLAVAFGTGNHPVPAEQRKTPVRCF